MSNPSPIPVDVLQTFSPIFDWRISFSFCYCYSFIPTPWSWISKTMILLLPGSLGYTRTSTSPPFENFRPLPITWMRTWFILVSSVLMTFGREGSKETSSLMFFDFAWVTNILHISLTDYYSQIFSNLMRYYYFFRDCINDTKSCINDLSTLAQFKGPSRYFSLSPVA